MAKCRWCAFANEDNAKICDYCEAPLLHDITNVTVNFSEITGDVHLSIVMISEMTKDLRPGRRFRMEFSLTGASLRYVPSSSGGNVTANINVAGSVTGSIIVANNSSNQLHNVVLCLPEGIKQITILGNAQMTYENKYPGVMTTALGAKEGAPK